jgi:hypothetical protein
MIAANSPQARGRSERSFGTWQGRLPQELRLAGIRTVEGANAFLRERYIGEFNAEFGMPAAEKGTAFRRTARSDLNWIFAVQTERVVGQDKTVAIRERSWQIDKNTIPQHVGGKYGYDPRTPGRNHLDPLRPSCSGRYSSTGEKLSSAPDKERRGKGPPRRREFLF